MTLSTAQERKREGKVLRVLSVESHEEDLICNRVTVDFSLAVTNDILFHTVRNIGH
jgi:hypothetical protein